MKKYDDARLLLLLMILILKHGDNFEELIVNPSGESLVLVLQEDTWISRP